jgi:hypothetical protein
MIPGGDIEPEDEDVDVPILLIQQPGYRSTRYQQTSQPTSLVASIFNIFVHSCKWLCFLFSSFHKEAFSLLSLGI